MNCGSPQNLKACEKCDTINEKNESKCHGCGASLSAAVFGDQSIPKQPASVHHTEKRALVEETLNLKELLAELEEDFRKQLSREQRSAIKAVHSESSPLISPTSPIETETQPLPSPPIVVEPPAYLQPLLSEPAKKDSYSTGWRVLSVILLLALVCGGIVRYGVIGNDIRPSKPEAILNGSFKGTIQSPTQQATSPSPAAEFSAEEGASRN